MMTVIDIKQSFKVTPTQAQPTPNRVSSGAEYLADIDTFTIDGLNYFYVIKDHLSSPRVTFTDANNDNSPEVTDVQNYYAFGLEWEDTTTEGVPNYRQSYNDKEAISYTNYLEFEARGYIKSINLFDGPDPISQKFPHLATNNYAGLSPVANIDLWGLQAASYMNNFKQRVADIGNHIASKLTGNTVNIQTTDGDSDSVPIREISTQEIGEGMQNFGDAVAFTGLAISIIAPEFGIPLAIAGDRLSTSGTVVEVLSDVRDEGITSETVTDVGVEVLFELSSTPLINVIENSDMDKQAKDIIKSRVEMTRIVTENAVETKIEHKRDNE